MKIAFSITCHESVECIVDQCENIKKFTCNAIIIIHINKVCDDIYHRLLEQVNRDYDLKNYIFISPFRIDTGKDKFSLHEAHILNLKYLRLLALEFDYLILEASNSLMVRHGIEDFIRSFDVGIGRSIPSGYWADRISMHKSIHQFIESFESHSGSQLTLYKGCHEGSYFKDEHVDEIFNIVSALSEYCALKNDKPTYPTEEVWFQIATEIYYSKKSIKISNTTTYLPWINGLRWSIIDIQSFLERNDFKNKYSIKRIERDIENQERKFIRNLM